MPRLALLIAILLGGVLVWIASMGRQPPAHAIDNVASAESPAPNAPVTHLAPIASPEGDVAPPSRSKATEAVSGPGELTSHAMMNVPIPPNRAGLVVIVRGVDGPIEGAAVTISERVRPQFAGELDAEGLARTDANGAARFFVRSMLTVPVAAAAPDQSTQASTTVTSPRDGDQREVTLTLASATVGGVQPIVVLDEGTGQRLAGAKIKVRSPDGTLVRLETDSQGEAALPAVTSTSAEIELEGYQTRVLASRASAQASTIQTALRRPARLHGSIAGAADGRRNRWNKHVELRLIGSDPSKGERNERMLLMERIEQDGTWSLEAIEVPYDAEQLEHVRVLYREHDSVRVLADDVTLLPNQSLEIIDPWEGASPWEIAVTHEDGTPIGSSMSVDLKCIASSTGAQGETFRFVADRHGKLVIDALPSGEWEASVPVPLGGADACITQRLRHDGSSDGAITLTGCTPLRGRIDRPDDMVPGRVHLRFSVDGRTVDVGHPSKRTDFRYDLAPKGTSIHVQLLQQTEEIDRSPDRETPHVWKPIAETEFAPGAAEAVLILQP